MSPEEKIRVTVIIPALNSEATIGECLSSVFRQTEAGGSYDVLVVDNGSTDRTITIAEENGARVLKGPGLTVAGLRNLGAKNATGDILAFVDSDCVINANWLKNAISLFDDPKIGVVGAPTSVPENGTWVQRSWYAHRKRMEEREFVAWLPTENLLVRREIFEKVGGFNEKLVTCEDVDLCYRIGERSRIVSDLSVSSVHLGEARTLRQFFRKERWRGKGSLMGIAFHGIKIDEFPSLFAPIYGLTVTIFFIITVFRLWTVGDVRTMLLFAGVLVLPTLGMAIKTSRRINSVKYLFPLTLLYAVYSIARGTSLFSSGNVGRR